MTDPRRRCGSEDPGRRRNIRSRLRCAINSATTLLAEAGIDSARFDAEELAAHLAGTVRGRLALLDAPGDAFFVAYQESVAARSRRIPLQHLTGTAAFGPLTLTVGPGVFIPRPETEAMLEWAVVQPLPPSPLIVDLCTGSGALALGLAAHWPRARVIGVDDSEIALDYARINAGGTAVELLHADVTAPGALAQFDGQADLVVSNPPYVPDGAELSPEVSQHDPSHAVFGGKDGMAVIAALAGPAGRLLAPGGLFAVEHDDSTSGSTVELLTAAGTFDDIVTHRDLTGTLRFVTARRNGARL